MARNGTTWYEVFVLRGINRLPVSGGQKRNKPARANLVSFSHFLSLLSHTHADFCIKWPNKPSFHFIVRESRPNQAPLHFGEGFQGYLRVGVALEAGP